MGRKRGKKRWGLLLLAGILAAVPAGPAAQAESGTAEERAGSYTKSGTFHIDQFGEYDIDADVTVTDGKITDITITGANFGGTYAEVNKTKLASAIEGMAGSFLGLEDTDTDSLKEIDAVSGATYSSNGIKEAVADALGLDLSDSSAPAVPSETPEPGTYDVTVAVRSDVVDHSLVQTETADAVLTVEEDGQMRLSYRMVSGTDQEPMYILGFNGYYTDNDPEQELTMDGVDYSTEERNGYTVVTDVSFPLTGLSQYYYNNTYIYVPAMSNLNGEISGILFENGRFSVKTIVTMYWDTLKKQETGTDGDESTEEKDMEISADIGEETSSPSCIVSVPSSLSMGKLTPVSDNIQEYEIRVSTENRNGTVTVSAPEGGLLYSGDNELAFANDFGTQSFQADGTESKGSDSEETALYGRIIISGKDVGAAAPGNYTGVTTFTITCGDGAADPDDPGNTGDPDNPGDTEDPDNPGGTEDPDDPGSGELDIYNLEDGVYSITGRMVKTDKTTLSMSDNAINHTIKLTVRDGKYYITLDLKGLNISGQLGYLGGLKYFLTGYTQDQYGNPVGELADAVVESYQLNEDGTRVSDDYGTDYPDQVTFELIPEALEDGYAPLQVFVPIMESIAEGVGTQPVFLALDWDTLEAAEEDDPAFTDDNEPGNGNQDGGDDDGSGLNGGSGLDGGSGLPGGNTLGGASLGGNSLGGSSLGGSSLGSGLSFASSVKTGDTSEDIRGWAALLVIGCGVLGAGILEKRRGKKESR